MSNAYQPYQPTDPNGSQPEPTYGAQPGYGTQPVPVAGQPYPPMSYPNMSYPQPMMARPEHPQATTVLILGILGLVVAGVLGPVAWFMGNKAIKECEAGTYTRTGPLTAGRILGIIGTILLIVSVVVIILVVVIGLITAATLVQQ